MMDSSGSIGASNYITMKNFVANAIVAFNLTKNSRIGVITFESNPTTRIQLGPIRNVRRLAASVRRIYYTGGYTATDRALHAMLAAFGREDPDRLRIGILLTDGQSNDPSDTIQAANIVHSSGIIMYTIGIGNVNLAELETIATHPSADYSFLISSFAASRFNQLLLPLVSQTCTSKWNIAHLTVPAVYLIYCAYNVPVIKQFPIVYTHQLCTYIYTYSTTRKRPW